MRVRVGKDGLWFLLTVVLSLGFGVFLSLHRATDPFLYFDTSFTSSQMGHAGMVIPESGPYASLSFVPGREMLLITLSNMLGLQPAALQFLPIGIIAVSVVLFQLLRYLTQSAVIAATGTLYLTLNLSHATALYSDFAHAFALPLFLAAIWLGLRVIEDRSRRGILLLFLLFLGAELIHYTFAAWIVLALAGATAVMWLRSKTLAQEAVSSGAPYLVLALGAFFLAFNEAIYRSFLPLVTQEALASGVDRLLSMLALAPASPPGVEFRYRRDWLIGLVSAVAVGLALVPVCVGLLFDTVRSVRRRFAGVPQWDLRTALIAGIILVGVADAFSYSIRGSISTKAISLLFPILGLLYVGRFGGRRLQLVLAGALLVTTLVKIPIFYGSGYVVGAGSGGVGPADAASGRAWLDRHAGVSNPTVVADLSLYGQMLLAEPNPPSPVLNGYTVDRFAHVVGAATGPWADAPDFVLLDTRSTQPALGFVFQAFRPLSDYLHQIRENPSANIVYDGGSLLILQPRREGR